MSYLWKPEINKTLFIIIIFKFFFSPFQEIFPPLRDTEGIILQSGAYTRLATEQANETG